MEQRVKAPEKEAFKRKSVEGEGKDQMVLALRATHIRTRDCNVLTRARPAPGVRKRPFSFYGEYKVLIWIAIAIFAVLATMIVLMTVNILLRKKAQKDLRRSQQRMELALRGADLGLWDINIQTGHIIQHVRAAEIYGYSLDEMATSDHIWESRIHPDDRARVLECRDRHLEGASPMYEAEYRLQTKSGEWKWILSRGKVVDHDKQGKPLRMTGTLLDITDRKRAEQEQEQLISELEARNAELERFTYTVSHDLKSPLITIKGFLGMLEKDAARGDTERMKDDIGRISDAADKMNDLLQELLELSRIGRMINPPEEVPFLDLVQGAMETVSGRLAERHVHVKIASNLPVIYGDAPRVQEVLENLIDNAVKFMGDEPNPVIEIGTRKDHGETIFYVKDNGIGIDPKYHDKVFGLFDKLEPKSEGTGVGMAIVKRIIELHGGRIWVESDGAGTGSTFCFRISEKVGQTTESLGEENSASVC